MKFKLVFLALLLTLALYAITGCASKKLSSTGIVGEYDELFKDDGKFVPINSAEIQRQIEQVR